MSYLDRLRQIKKQNTPIDPTAQTAKTTLCSLCRSPHGRIYFSSAFADFDERVAIPIESSGHSPDEARWLALEEMGGEQLEIWKYHIERLPAANTSEGFRLVKTAIAFLEGPVAAMAAYYGWDDWEVFGVLNGPPRAMVHRHDTMGLIPALAWSRIGSKLVDIDCDRAIIETYTGNTLTHKRPLTGRRYAVPVWWSGILHEAGVENGRS